MSRPAGNIRLKAARLAAGYRSQQALCDAITRQADAMGLRGVAVSVRQVRRWESPAPPWPQPEVAQVLTRLLGQTLEGLGFTPPWGTATAQPGRAQQRLTAGSGFPTELAAVPVENVAVEQPASVGLDFEAVTQAHRHLYWSVAPATLYPAVLAHAGLGCALLPQTRQGCRRGVAVALAESFLLAGRIEFFDMRQPERAQDTFLRALQAAGEADDALMGSAILAHAAFIPGWSRRREDAVERLTAARTYARRGRASGLFLAWLDAVEAECETLCGAPRTALHLIGHAEDMLRAGGDHPTPVWLDWFSETRLAAFKGNTQLKAGHLPQARQTLQQVLEDLPPESAKQRRVILADIAAVEAAVGRPEEACRYAALALDQLSLTWYATGMDRVREARRALAAWRHERCVRELDDHLYQWGTTVSALQR
ncbi:transcriptional regulator [Streptoverticillium reticulum]|uniref:transcriptional regulator n=1 Tax=Streptoverticillium reticulum TaxID=1433415 RepID=UPI0039BF86BA